MGHSSTEIESLESRRLLSAGDPGLGLSPQMTGVASPIDRDFAPDGSMVYSSGATLRRLTAQGTPDLAFAGDGVAELSLSSTSCVVVTDSGEIYTAGNGRVIRLLSNGAFDATFGSNGGISLPGGVIDRVESIAKDTEGRILLAGPWQNPVTRNVETVILRLSATGQLETAFGGTGRKLVDLSGPADYIKSLKPMPDGSWLALTSLTNNGRSTSPTVIARLTSDFDLDPYFASNGRIMRLDQLDEWWVDVAPTADGKFLALSKVEGGHLLYRFNANGRPDVTFGINGVSSLAITGETAVLTVRPDGAIRIAGTVHEYTSSVQPTVRPAVLALTSEGKLQEGFGIGGFAALKTLTSGRVMQQTVLPDGNLLVHVAINGGADANKLYWQIVQDMPLTGGRVIEGTVYSDANANGRRDTSETGPTIGLRVLADLNDNGVADAGEAVVVPAADGTYQLVAPSDGTFVLRLLDAPGNLVISEPLASDKRLVLIASGGSARGQDLGLAEQSALFQIGARHLQASNGSSGSPSNPPLLGAVMYLDLNQNRQHDAIEPQNATNATGQYFFNGLPSGVYVVRQLSPVGYRWGTQPVAFYLSTGGSTSGATYASDDSSLGGRVFNDFDGNGFINSGVDTNRTGDTIYLDLNNNSQIDTDEPRTLVTDSGGGYLFSRVVPGVYTPRIVRTSAQFTTPFVERAYTVGQGQYVDAHAFGLRTAPAGEALITGTMFLDADADGQRDPGEKALGNRTVYVDANNNGVYDNGEKTAIGRSGEGYFTITGLTPGTHTLRVDELPNHTGAHVGNGGVYSVTLGDGQVENLTVPIAPVGYFTGTVFYDSNANGAADAGEPPLANWRVYIDSNADSVFTPGERSTLTDAFGRWILDDAGLVRGNAFIRVETQGVEPSLPSSGAVSVPLVQGIGVNDIRFGLKQATVIIQAEDGAITGGKVATEYSPYFGTGYVDYGASGSSVTWTLERARADTSKLELVYANGSTVNRPVQIFVNDVLVATRPLAPTGAWTNWWVESVPDVAIPVGTVSIRVVSTISVGPNIDLLAIGPNTPVVPPTVPPTSPPPAAVKFNFQPAAAPTVAGYLVDSGQTYAARNGRTYGWSTSHTSLVVDRNKNSNQLIDTNVSVNAGGKWELAVPNGTYTVKIGVGDSGAASRNNVYVEGKVLFNYQSLAANAFASKAISVAVTDGKLTLGIGSAGSGTTKIGFVEVTPATSPPTSPPPTSPPPPTGGGVKVHFQPAAAPAVAGYLVDAGGTYAARNGKTYGWTASHADAVVDRNINSNQLLDTNVGVKAAGKWELAVANGTYTVKVGVGDSGAASKNNIYIEGQQLFNYQSLAANVFSTKSITVNVTDGKLTLGVGSSAAGLTRINFVEIT